MTDIIRVYNDADQLQDEIEITNLDQGNEIENALPEGWYITWEGPID